MNKKLFLTMMSAAVISLAACSKGPDKPNTPPAPPAPSIDYVPVFVMIVIYLFTISTASCFISYFELIKFL